MRIDLLHIADCPNWQATGRLLRAALDSTGHHDVRVRVRLIDSKDAADRWAFAGSPTILADGVDLFPSSIGTSALACRTYVTPDGIAGHPTRAQLEDAISSHA